MKNNEVMAVKKYYTRLVPSVVENAGKIPEKYVKTPPCMWSDRPEPQDTEKKGSTAVRQTVMEQFR
jgi:hypothetical protein